MEYRKRLSRWLYSVLESVGASERLRRLHRHIAVTDEIVTTITTSFMQCKLNNVFICGSSYEGTVTPALISDKDVINCLSYMPVVLDAAAAPIGMSLLMVRDSWTYPGYVKLQRVVGDGQLFCHHTLPQGRYNYDYVGRQCYKHFRLNNMHGPAGRRFDENGVHVEDFVAALRCDDIPQCAVEWIIRPRPYEWPSRDQLQAMSQMGCMVVGVGHFSSGEKEIEWRMSYTLQERMLMSSLNPVQHKVYIVLKMLKKDILGSIFHEETLTSYHFKTCVLYAVHMSPARIWTPDNIMNCIVWCLKLMLKWLVTNYCPSYLTQHQNLFMKEGFSRLRTGLMKEIRKIIESGHQFLYVLQCDNVGAILRSCDLRMYREVATDDKNEYIRSMINVCVKCISVDAIEILRFRSNGNYDPFTLTLVLKNLKKAQRINNHTQKVIRSAMVYQFPWLHLHIANGLASFTHMCPDGAARKRVMKLVDLHLQEAIGVDLVNQRLAVASVLYKFEKYEECSLLLHLIESDFTNQVMSCCPCTKSYSVQYYDVRDRHKINKNIAAMSIRHFIKSMTACCVIFLPSATVIVPEPLQYEMQRSLGTLHGSRDEKNNFWFDWVVVDAKVYMYFMQYLVSSKLLKDEHREVARDNLRAEIHKDGLLSMLGQKSWLGHKDTAYNLLGWIYTQEEHWAEAYRCFHASWEIRPFHNAAKFHMRDLTIRVAEKRL